jgi:peptidyl-prolyl cis-trans isomerase C
MLRIALLVLFTFATACNRQSADHKSTPAGREEGALFRVGSIVVYEADLKHELEERHAAPNDKVARTKALDDLVTHAQFAEAALASNLDRDPAVRAQIARTLAARFKEQNLLPRLKEISAPIPEARLRELYKAGEDRFRSNEKRQVAVLWLNPNGNPDRQKQYQEKLTAAREWLLNNKDLKDHPDQGFSVLSVDHSDHAASRYKGGVVGWLEREGAMDRWSKAVAEIVFSLKEPGEISAVITRSEGIFLVRYLALKPATLRPFEAVSGELEREERLRLKTTAETEFESGVKAKHPVQWFSN